MGAFARRCALSTIACAAVITTACSGGSGPIVPPSASPAAPHTSSSVSGFPSSSASAPTSGSTATCATHEFCDDFSNPSSGWPDENKTNFFAKYDPYLGGTYRIGERHDATVSEDAPVKISTLASDYSVQVDVDAVLGSSMPAADNFGISCWEHLAKDTQGTAAFIFLINQTRAAIGLWDDEDGSYHQLKTAPVPSLAPAGQPNHLTAQCLQRTANGGAVAELSISLNGTPLVQTTYAKGVSTYAWDVGDQVGLLASGTGSDIFYDNFKIVSKCAGDFC